MNNIKCVLCGVYSKHLNWRLSTVWFIRYLCLCCQDQDVLHAWLMDIHFEEYFPLFVSAGYDMYTISRMTPEDLTAVGIKKPNHRKKLKAEIAQLSISDGLPDYIPVSLTVSLYLGQPLNQFIHSMVSSALAIQVFEQKWMLLKQLDDLND